MTATARVSAIFFLATALSLGMMAAMTSTASAQGQVEMNEAIEHLRAAKNALAHAAANKGGHRENAMHLVDQAISEVEAGKAYALQHAGDKRHDHDQHHDHDHDHDHD